MRTHRALGSFCRSWPLGPYGSCGAIWPGGSGGSNEPRRTPTLDRPPSLTDAVVAHIRDGIIRGDYPPGRPLTEACLSEELGTSRGTVREALRELSGLGGISCYLCLVRANLQQVSPRGQELGYHAQAGHRSCRSS